MITQPLAILLGQLLGTALACGINLYATISLIGLASRYGWTDAVPPGLRGLESTVLIGSALVLYLIELAVDKVPYFDTIWDAIHTLVRPLAAGLLGALALEAQPLAFQIVGGLVAATAALMAHSAKAGLRIALHATGRSRLATRVSLAEDLLSVVLVMGVLLLPTVASVLAALGLLVLAVRGLPYWRAAILGARGFDARLRGFFGTPGWREREDLPAHVAALVEPDTLGIAPPRALRAAADHLPGAGGYRNGWLVIQRDRIAFVYRSPLGPRRIDLRGHAVGTAHPGFLVDRIRMDDGPGFNLLLLKDGPPLDIALAELRSAASWA
jgi:hypothetical protein